MSQELRTKECFAFLIPKLQNYPETTISNKIVRLALCYFSASIPVSKVSESIDGREGPILWPARSPDLTPCRYFLWRYNKDIVYHQRPETISEFKIKIRLAVQSINGNILRKVYKNMETRLNFVIREQRGCLEH